MIGKQKDQDLFNVDSHVVMIGIAQIDVLMCYQMGFGNDWLPDIIESNFTYMMNPQVMNKFGLGGGSGSIGGITIEIQTRKTVQIYARTKSLSGDGALTWSQIHKSTIIDIKIISYWSTNYK